MWRQTVLALSLGLGALCAQAQVKVDFVEPGKFSDIRDNFRFNQPEVLKSFEAHFTLKAEQYWPGKAVVFKVTDVDLAGEVEPFPRNGSQWVRVMRSSTPPAIAFSYTVSEPGAAPDAVLLQGQAKLRDINYQDRMSQYSSNEPFRYEYRMIDRWFEQQFGKPVVEKKAAKKAAKK